MRRSGIKTQPSITWRSGYTLVEMLIASILVATLMATVWNLTSLYSGFLTAGRSQAEEQQLARSLMDIISADLHSLVTNNAGDSSISTKAPIPTPESTGFPNVENQLTSDTELSEAEMSDLELLNLFGLNSEGQIIPSFDIRGNDHTLKLTITVFDPQVELLPVGEQTGESFLNESLTPDTTNLSTEPNSLPGPPRAPGYRRIVYQFVPPRIIETEMEEALEPGLYRYEVPIEHLSLLTHHDELMGADNAAESRNVDELIQFLTEQGVTTFKKEHVPEVVGCEFEYLTQFGWESSWAPHDDGRNLTAIRIRLRLLSRDEHQELMTALGVTDEPLEENELTAEAAIELPMTFDNEQDPFAEFEPRTFERVILMSLPKRLSLGDDDGMSVDLGADSFSPPTFGGQP